MAKESAPGDANLARNGRISIRPAPPLRSGRNFRSFFGAKISAGAATSRSAATRSCANTPPSNRRCNIAAGRGLKNAGHLDFENELRKNPGRESLQPGVRATACPSPSFKMSHFKSRSPKMGSRNFLDGLTPAFGTTKSWSHGRRRHSPLRFQLKKADPHFWDRAARSQNRGSAHISTTKTGGQGGLWTLGRQVQNSGSSIAIHLGASSGPKTGVSHFQS